MTEMTIFATPNKHGKITLVDAQGHETEEGFEYSTKEEAMKAATQLWPANSVWKGHKVKNGWRIKID
jgi:hypothetical protein